MSNHTAQDLLAAVGVDWQADPKFHAWDNGLTSTQIYTGPALGTPELDAVLLVDGVKWCRDNWQFYQDVNDAIYKLNETEIDATDTFVLEWLLFHCDQPGARLARAIWAAMKGTQQ